MTLRLDGQMYVELETVAIIDGLPMVEVVREAVDRYVRKRLTDEGFRKALQEHLDAQQQMLGRATKATP